MSDHDLDAELVERARQGDAEAFGTLVAQYQRLLTSVAFGIAGDPGKTEDLVQDAFLAAWRALPQYRGEASFKNWLCRILVNKSYSALRWAGLRKWLSLDHPQAAAVPDGSPEADPEGMRLRSERSQAVREAVAGLPPQQRTAVALRASGLDVAEVARAMGVAEGTVKAHLHQARARLAEVLEIR
ncbi:MAG: RNA polymerase sigma factor [Elusimicrobia bacterium]|nr:RNA polymerase sigma factor [Elusimicrobiota bacterium]